ncbi:MAG: hypothetical protein QOJ82_3747 [Solirubrobacteraceae bacterium]|nr:hypothetical protein [Solirubrobacteraceae bacterium]
MATSTTSPVAQQPPPEALSEVLSTARAAVEQEFQISERLDAKARALVTLAGQWFAVAQAVSAVAFATKKPHDWMLWTVAGTALAGGIALGLLFFFCWRVWRIRDEPAVSPRGLLQMHSAAVRDPDAAKLLVEHYAAMLRDRRKTNKSRADALAVAQGWWLVAMALPFVQLGFALATRLFA